MGKIIHTPGPWLAEEADHFGDHNIVLGNAVEAGDYRAVAAVVHPPQEAPSRACR